MVFLSNAVSDGNIFLFEAFIYSLFVCIARIEEVNSKGELHHDSVGTTVYGTRWASEDIPR